MPEPLKVAVVGSRGYPRMDLVRACVGRIWAMSQGGGIHMTGHSPWWEPIHEIIQAVPVVIISGTEPRKPWDSDSNLSDVDRCAIAWARHCGLPTLVFEANWTSLGKSAGPIRNTTIVESCDILVAFWDFMSPGTSNSIRKALSYPKPLIVFNPQGTLTPCHGTPWTLKTERRQ